MDELEREGLSPYGTSVDVWAVGLIAYELVTGAAPFTRKGEPELDTMNRILQRYDIDFPGSMSPQWAHFVRCGAMMARLPVSPATMPTPAPMLYRRGALAPLRSALVQSESRKLHGCPTCVRHPAALVYNSVDDMTAVWE